MKRNGTGAVYRRSMMRSMNDLRMIGGWRLGSAAVESAGVGPNFALTTSTRCAVGSTPVPTLPGDLTDELANTLIDKITRFRRPINK